jgi:predicted hotdog family 3-hydroxylacyl-ACP dehydratase
MDRFAVDRASPMDRQWIMAHIPHQGRMCLLDEVVEWDAERIRCRSATHRDADHPLRSGGRLGIACGIEYAAQAMALHGALTATAAGAAAADLPAAGFLAGLRAVRFHVLRLDDIPGDLTCCATRHAADRTTALYEFELHARGVCLLRGRATVVMDVGKRLPR